MLFKGLPNYLLQGTNHPPRVGGEGGVSSLAGFLHLLGSNIRGATSAPRQQTLRQHDMAMKQQIPAQFSSSFPLLVTYRCCLMVPFDLGPGGTKNHPASPRCAPRCHRGDTPSLAGAGAPRSGWILFQFLVHPQQKPDLQPPAPRDLHLSPDGSGARAGAALAGPSRRWSGAKVTAGFGFGLLCSSPAPVHTPRGFATKPRPRYRGGKAGGGQARGRVR